MLYLLDDYKFTGQWWRIGGRKPGGEFSGTMSYVGKNGKTTLDVAGVFANIKVYDHNDSVKGPTTITEKEICTELPAILPLRG